MVPIPTNYRHYKHNIKWQMSTEVKRSNVDICRPVQTAGSVLGGFWWLLRPPPVCCCPLLKPPAGHEAASQPTPSILHAAWQRWRLWLKGLLIKISKLQIANDVKWKKKKKITTFITAKQATFVWLQFKYLARFDNKHPN